MSKSGKFLGIGMKAVKPIINSLGLNKRRKGHNLLGVIKGVPKEVGLSPAPDFPCQAEWIIPKEENSAKIILFVHGGAYLSGSIISSRPVAGLLCQVTESRVLTFEYGLAPENPFPRALEDAVKVWKHLTKDYNPKNIVVVGESAGGGLALALGLYLKDNNMELPIGMVTLSAWADLTITNESHKTLDKKDPILSSDELRIAALKYSHGEYLKNPYISPVYGDFTGFCPVLVHVGSDEVLLDDSKILYERLKEANVEAKLSIFEGMWHVWHGFEVPESIEALNEIKEFMEGLSDGEEMV
ncbi:MAG TPA: alpha/beta hydrolase [Clostridia bacterium]|nr:alpha/beta hydrolase [Clostridiaceae bacterium]HOA31144.1 alpha/beta hydrolase [Clostridia bacterium]HPZ52496.1 alpha/beta hydrolase [Clostridia bacterium]